MLFIYQRLIANPEEIISLNEKIKKCISYFIHLNLE